MTGMYNDIFIRSTISQLYFGKELYMFQTDLLSIISSLNTVFTATGICHSSYDDCLLAKSGWILLAVNITSMKNTNCCE